MISLFAGTGHARGYLYLSEQYGYHLVYQVDQVPHTLGNLSFSPHHVFISLKMLLSCNTCHLRQCEM